MENFSEKLFENNLPTIFNLLQEREQIIESSVVKKNYCYKYDCNGNVTIFFDVRSDFYHDSIGSKVEEIESVLTETVNEVMRWKVEECLSVKVCPSDPYVPDWRSDRFPSDDFVLNFLGDENKDLSVVKELWNKALGRRTDDPSGAVTASSTLLEQVCSEILSRRCVPEEEQKKLTGLKKKFDKVASLIGLQAKEYEDEAIRRLVGNCVSFCYSISEIRNSAGDAHGGVKRYKPKERHAEFVVNLAGALSVFLLKTDIDDERRG